MRHKDEKCTIIMDNLKLCSIKYVRNHFPSQTSSDIAILIACVFYDTKQLLITSQVQVQGEAKLLLRLIYYTNPEGKLSNGHCCDGWPIRCERNGGCDYYFRICLDEISG